MSECVRCGGQLQPTSDPSVIRCDNGHEEIVWTVDVRAMLQREWEPGA